MTMTNDRVFHALDDLQTLTRQLADGGALPHPAVRNAALLWLIDQLAGAAAGLELFARAQRVLDEHVTWVDRAERIASTETRNAYRAGLEYSFAQAWIGLLLIAEANGYWPPPVHVLIIDVLNDDDERW